MIEVISAGTGANTAIRDKFPRAVLTRRFDSGFATGLMYKDINLYLEAAEQLQAPARVCSAVHQLWLETHEQFGPDSDFTRIVQLVEQRAGAQAKPTNPDANNEEQGNGDTRTL
jgi:3-hydroxyisobutyrate dehydrogenase-like beta-hydroxyacid dehydrogenase